MRQSFEVVTPASSLLLVSIEQLRVAAGLAEDDDSKDAGLTLIGEALSTDIATTCGVVGDGVHPVTLMSETVSETFWHFDRPCEVFLSRRFVSAISEVSECGHVLTSADYKVDRASGMLYRISGGRPWVWRDGAVGVTYTAGFDAVPADLQMAAAELARLRLSSGSRDPLVKSESIEIPDVQTRRLDFWVGALPGSSAGPVPSEIMTRLSRFMSVLVA